jgi:type IV secretory pathway TraG/TraD family ATPase VirD4
MQGTNVLFGQIAVVFGIVIAGVWSATQWTAAALGYQLRLGSPWFDFSARRSITRGACSSGGSSSMPTRRMSSTPAAPLRGQRPVAVLVAIGMSIWRSRQSAGHDLRLGALGQRGGHSQGGPDQPPACSSASIASSTCGMKARNTS